MFGFLNSLGRVFSVRFWRLPLVVLVPILLSACGGIETPSLFGADDNETKAANSPTLPKPDASLLYAGVHCPKVELLPGTEIYRAFVPRKEPSQANLTYQATVSQTARECQPITDGVSAKVGIAGRILLGASGQNDKQIAVPLRIVVLDEATDEVLYSKLHRISANIKSPASSTLWSVVDNSVRYPIDRKVKIKAGFDPG